MSGLFRFLGFWSKLPKTKKSNVLFVYFLCKKSAFCLKMTADFFVFLSLVVVKQSSNSHFVIHYAACGTESLFSLANLYFLP